MDTKELLKELLGENQRSSLAEHYGLTEPEFSKITKQMICDFIQNDSKHKILDKHFPDLSAEDRVKVECYAKAQGKYEKLTE